MFLNAPAAFQERECRREQQGFQGSTLRDSQSSWVGGKEESGRHPRRAWERLRESVRISWEEKSIEWASDHLWGK